MEVFDSLILHLCAEAFKVFKVSILNAGLPTVKYITVDAGMKNGCRSGIAGGST